MKPMLKIGDHDYTDYVAEIKPVRNDLDSDKSGRNLLDGLMYRARIAQKDKYSVSFLSLTEDVVKRLSEDTADEYLKITTLDPKTNRHIKKSYYIATLNYGTQWYSKSEKITKYDGVSFDMTER